MKQRRHTWLAYSLLLCLLTSCWPAEPNTQTAAAQAILSLAQALDGHAEASAQQQLELWQIRLSPGLLRRVQTEMGEGVLSTGAFTLIASQLLGADGADTAAQAGDALERWGMSVPFDQNSNGLLEIAELEVFLSRPNPVTPTLFEYQRPLGPLRPVSLPW